MPRDVRESLKLSSMENQSAAMIGLEDCDDCEDLEKVTSGEVAQTKRLGTLICNITVLVNANTFCKYWLQICQ